MAKTDVPADDPLRVRDRVTATRDLRSVPEGTTGTVKVANGLTWARYWVKFDNGEWLGSVSSADLVRQSDWGPFQVRRAEEAARPKVEAKVETAEAEAGDGGGPSGGAGGGPASRVPAHIVERSQKARERVGPIS